MRGTHQRQQFKTLSLGIIPAYAGNTEHYITRLRPIGDHPRVCGEHIECLNTLPPKPGSSPRMRGTLKYGYAIRQYLGIIPAYAGNTHVPPSSLVPDRDHPRVCGEHPIQTDASTGIAGSSPRMRGTLADQLLQIPRLGIIPAYAGNTKLDCRVLYATGDHPRVCGEHPIQTDASTGIAGSSPRMRGTRPTRADSQCRHGIIPAYAGNTRRAHLPPSGPRDHPRVCGEHCTVQPTSKTSMGSSPRMRGTLSSIVAFFTQQGIIPAYAGNTLSNPLASFLHWDHPRVCGEHKEDGTPRWPTLGSSPRMRGTHSNGCLKNGTRGIIPAYAGNTHSASSRP